MPWLRVLVPAYLWLGGENFMSGPCQMLYCQNLFSGMCQLVVLHLHLLAHRRLHQIHLLCSKSSPRT